MRRNQDVPHQNHQEKEVQDKVEDRSVAAQPWRNGYRPQTTEASWRQISEETVSEIVQAGH